MLSLFCNYQASLSQTKFKVKLRVEAQRIKLMKLMMARPVFLFSVPAFYFCTFFNDFSINTDIHIYQFSKNSELYYYLMELILLPIFSLSEE